MKTCQWHLFKLCHHLWKYMISVRPVSQGFSILMLNILTMTYMVMCKCHDLNYHALQSGQQLSWRCHFFKLITIPTKRRYCQDCKSYYQFVKLLCFLGRNSFFFCICILYCLISISYIGYKIPVIENLGATLVSLSKSNGLFQKRSIPPMEEINNSPPPPVRTSYKNLRHSLDDCPPLSLDAWNFLCKWGMNFFLRYITIVWSFYMPSLFDLVG